MGSYIKKSLTTMAALKENNISGNEIFPELTEIRESGNGYYWVLSGLGKNVDKMCRSKTATKE